MPINLERQPANIGNVAFEWAVSEYEKHERSRRWYLIMGILGVSALVYAVLSANYLFALILVLFGIILFLQDMGEPMEVPVAITDTGVIIGNKYYPYKEFTRYWIVYMPPEVKNIYFSTTNLIRHRLQVPLLEVDPRPIREFLNKYIMEDTDQEEEPLSDRLARIFKLH